MSFPTLTNHSISSLPKVQYRTYVDSLVSKMAGKKAASENTKKAAGNAKKAEVAAQKAAIENQKKAAAEDEEWSKGAKSNAKK